MRACARCNHQDVSIIGRSPVEGCWELYLCRGCQYVWRSTETEELLAQTVKLGEQGLETILDSHSFTMKPLTFR